MPSDYEMMLAFRAAEYERKSKQAAARREAEYRDTWAMHRFVGKCRRCKAPIWIGLCSSAVCTQARSHSSSVGQTRAQLPPRMFASRMVWAEPRKLPVAILRMNEGTSIPVGQASTQGASWQK